MQVFDVSSCLLFHVCLLISRIGTLSTPFSRPRYFVLLHHKRKLEFFFTLGIFWIFMPQAGTKVFLTSFLYACMSANFTDWYLDYLFHIECFFLLQHMQVFFFA